MNRHREHVVGDVGVALFVEVVADPRSVREQMLDRHVVGDERQVGTEHGTGGGGEVERARFDQPHDRQRGQALPAARDPELGVDPVLDLEGAVREAVRPCERRRVGPVDAHDARERFGPRDLVDRVREIGVRNLRHRNTVTPASGHAE